MEPSEGPGLKTMFHRHILDLQIKGNYVRAEEEASSLVIYKI
jgi:hypothetical protein